MDFLAVDIKESPVATSSQVNQREEVQSQSRSCSEIQGQVATSSQVKPREEVPSQSRSFSETQGSDNSDLQEAEEVPSQCHSSSETQGSDNSDLKRVVDRITSNLNLARGGHAAGQGIVSSPSTSIYRLPENLTTGINKNFYEPELVSIGPYHKNKSHLREFERYKKHYAQRLLFLSTNELETFVIKIKDLEKQAKDCYFDVTISSDDFVEMMLVDGFFILDFLRCLYFIRDCVDTEDPIFTRRWLTPIIIRDLLKLENQLPYFVLSSLFELCGTGIFQEYTLPELAMNMFDKVAKMPSTNFNYRNWEGKHLLYLYYSCLTHPLEQIKENCSPRSILPVPSVTQLKKSGISFKARKHNNTFLGTSFHGRVLEIPTIAIDDFTISMLINCVALEQCEETVGNLATTMKYITGYTSFMTSLISEPSDVADLCSDGIIANLSKDDTYTAYLSNMLSKNIIVDVQRSYLTDQRGAINSYYNSELAYIRRTYCSSPWALISVAYLTILLLLAILQGFMSILNYIKK